MIFIYVAPEAYLTTTLSISARVRVQVRVNRMRWQSLASLSLYSNTISQRTFQLTQSEPDRLKYRNWNSISFEKWKYKYISLNLHTRKYQTTIEPVSNWNQEYNNNNNNCRDYFNICSRQLCRLAHKYLTYLSLSLFIQREYRVHRELRDHRITVNKFAIFTHFSNWFFLLKNHYDYHTRWML